MKTRKLVTILLTSLLSVAMMTTAYAMIIGEGGTSLFKQAPLGPTLNPRAVPKFVNQLLIPPVYVPTNITDEEGNLLRQEYTVYMNEFYQQVLPSGFPTTKVWGYAAEAQDPITGQALGFLQSSPGSTFEAIRGTPIQVKWVNNITSPHMFPVDPTLHWADPNDLGMPMPPFELYPPGYNLAQSSVPLVTHLHGAEVQATSDGGPDAWFTNDGKHGHGYSSEFPTDPNSTIYYYPNEQLPATLWYHDHALGLTRTNVMSGLAGFYLLRDANDALTPLLPKDQYEIPLAIQDRSFNVDGSMWFPTAGINPGIHPYWMPEFFGNSVMVNGKVWPNLDVEPRQYRFRVLDGSNARFYELSLWNKATNTFLPFLQIGGDGSYLPTPVTMTRLLIAPGERADILVDFSGLPAGSKIVLKNTAKTPFPNGAPADPQTVGQVMQFTVMSRTPVSPQSLPTTLLNMPVLTPNKPSRTLTLIEVMGPAGPAEILLDGQKWDAPISELPQVGSTEDWIIVNPTADTHPIHLHLVQFEVVSRQKFMVNKYLTDWMALNGMPPLMQSTQNLPSLTPYLLGQPSLPSQNELGWKDTVRMNPGEITTIRVRYAPQEANPSSTTPGVNLYPFDPTVGHGYVWHCHIIDHEDNEMMRPYKVVS